jgi:hypothetical protein
LLDTHTLQAAVTTEDDDELAVEKRIAAKPDAVGSERGCLESRRGQSLRRRIARQHGSEDFLPIRPESRRRWATETGRREDGRNQRVALREPCGRACSRDRRALSSGLRNTVRWTACGGHASEQRSQQSDTS